MLGSSNNMKSKNIVLYETYDGVRFVLERSLQKISQSINIYSSNWKNEIKKIIRSKNVDLLITELAQTNSNGLEVSALARKISPEISIIWITVLGCNRFREYREKIGNIRCIEKPLAIEDFRKDVFKALNIH